MKITRRQLRELIKEEMQLISEAADPAKAFMSAIKNPNRQSLHVVLGMIKRAIEKEGTDTPRVFFGRLAQEYSKEALTKTWMAFQEWTRDGLDKPLKDVDEQLLDTFDYFLLQRSVPADSGSLRSLNPNKGKYK